LKRGVAALKIILLFQKLIGFNSKKPQGMFCILTAIKNEKSFFFG